MRQSNRDREAWTALIEGRKEKKPSKYNNEKTGGFDSKKESRVAADLDALVRSGKIINLQYQVPITLIEGSDGVRGIKYIADFVYSEPNGMKHFLDAKGMKTQVYILKKKMLKLLHDIDIEEV